MRSTLRFDRGVGDMFDKKDCLYSVLCFFRSRDLDVSKILLQKALYALDFVKVPMSLEFEAYTYGPFCREIGDILDEMEIDSLVEIDGKIIRLTPEAPARDIGISEREYARIESILEQFVAILPDKDTSSFDMVELYGTVMYVMDVLDLEESEKPGEHCGHATPPPFEKTWKEVLRWKRDKFCEDQVLDAYRRIEKTLWRVRLAA